jgi:hypothetical protein
MGTLTELNYTVEVACPPYKRLLADLERELQSVRLPDDAEERIAKWLYETTAGQPEGRWAGPDTWQFAEHEPHPIEGMVAASWTTKTARDHYLATARELIGIISTPTPPESRDMTQEQEQP